MAKKSVVNRNLKRQQQVDKYRAIRKELVEISKQVANTEADHKRKFEAAIKLQKLPRNSSATRIRQRCVLTGRGRGVFRKFGLCRHAIRDLARFGKVPGLLKASW